MSLCSAAFSEVSFVISHSVSFWNLISCRFYSKSITELFAPDFYRYRGLLRPITTSILRRFMYRTRSGDTPGSLARHSAVQSSSHQRFTFCQSSVSAVRTRLRPLSGFVAADYHLNSTSFHVSNSVRRHSWLARSPFCCSDVILRAIDFLAVIGFCSSMPCSAVSDLCRICYRNVMRLRRHL